MYVNYNFERFSRFPKELKPTSSNIQWFNSLNIDTKEKLKYNCFN